jgi:RHS repeat-associated protein
MKRVKSDINGKVIYNVYDASGTLIHVDDLGTAKATDYIGKIARITNGNVTYLHKDHLGSASSGTDVNGLISWTEQYTPFGETILNPAANDNLDGYTGHIKDQATGLNYMQARYYDPALGRFLSIDPVGFTPDQPFMFWRYTYVGNDPINSWDPFGMQPEDCPYASRICGFKERDERSDNKDEKSKSKGSYKPASNDNKPTSQNIPKTKKRTTITNRFIAAQEIGGIVRQDEKRIRLDLNAYYRACGGLAKCLGKGTYWTSFDFRALKTKDAVRDFLALDPEWGNTLDNIAILFASDQGVDFEGYADSQITKDSMILRGGAPEYIIDNPRDHIIRYVGPSGLEE